jgi:HAD superfamily hydrolase (TIGR01509 family)
MALEAVIFDMDGTMIDSMPYHAVSWNKFFASKGLTITEAELKEKGHGTLYDIMPRFFGENISREESYRLGMEKEIIFREMYAPFMHPVSGLEAWLQKLKEHQIKIGLGTAADYSNTDFTIDTLGLRHYFDTIVTSDLVPEGKPSPAVYLYAATQLDVNPANCLVFEDTFSGVAAAKAAGMKVGVITTMHTPDEWEEKGVDLILSHYEEANLDYLVKLFR